MLRNIAVILNIALLCLLVYLLATKGKPSEDEILLVVLLFSAPAVSIVALYRNVHSNTMGLFSLFLERKRLEEQQRIEQLKASSKNA